MQKRIYHHIQNYEKEILELNSLEYTLRSIGKSIDSHTNKCTTLSPDIMQIIANKRQE